MVVVGSAIIFEALDESIVLLHIFQIQLINGRNSSSSDDYSDVLEEEEESNDDSAENAAGSDNNSQHRCLLVFKVPVKN